MSATNNNAAADNVSKVWSLDDPFLYAPEKPDGDPWDILLGPLLDKDSRQCASWADEVQNLLIFAGLFSAVVTTFIIESYRNLKPSSDDTMILLLSRIADRLDSSTNATSSLLPLTSFDSVQFSPSSSSIRTNALWFVSLVLSLATVLFGTISLQWLREHQSYPDLSPKQTFALFHMRSCGLREWHVAKLFTILPLFLQCAVVLFLAGLIDFLIEFGDHDVLIPVSVVIGFTLLFLFCTTALPVLQGASIYFRRSWTAKGSSIPSQCPYKSPQSYIFRNISSMFLHPMLVIYPSIQSSFKKVYQLLFSPTELTGFCDVIDPVSHYIANAWIPQSHWAQFDLAWLSLRDAFVRSAYGRSAGDASFGREPHESFPMYDATLALHESLHDKTTYSAQYHCLAEISEGIFPQEHISAESWDKYEMENDYFQDLLAGDEERAVSFSDFFKLNGPKQFQERYGSLGVRPIHTNKIAKAFHHENLHLILSNLCSRHSSDNGLAKHLLEVKLRLLGYFYYEQPHEPQARILASTYAPAIPACLFVNHEVAYNNRILTDEVFYFQYGNIFLGFFQRVGDNENARSLAQSVAVPHLSHFLRVGRRAIVNASPSVTGRRGQQDRFIATFNYITERLKEELSAAVYTEGHPSLLFYVASLFAKGLAASYFGPHLRLLLSTLQEYKQKIIDKGITNVELEGQFRVPAVYGPDVFTQEWWEFLNVQKGA